MRNRFCVYAHVDHLGDVFYVGCGNDSRPFATSSRNRAWKSKVESIPHYSVIVLASSDDADEMAKEESRLMKKFSPCCNFQPGSDRHPRRRQDAIALKRVKVGEVFEFVSTTRGYPTGLYEMAEDGPTHIQSGEKIGYSALAWVTVFPPEKIRPDLFKQQESA